MSGKIIKISIISIIALIIIFAAAAAGIYYYGVRQNKTIEAVGNVCLSSPKAGLGEAVTAVLLLKCPWHRKPLEAVAQPGNGASLVSGPAITRKSLGRGYNIWEISTEFKPYRTGSISAGKLAVTYNRYNDKTVDLNQVFEIPPFTCTPLRLGKKQDVIIAGRIAPSPVVSRRNMYIIVGLAALAALTVITLFVIRRYRKAKAAVLPLWAVVLNDLHVLRNNIRSGSVSLNGGFVTLTDIVRGYLEKRFELPASKQTTEEFLAEINQDGGPLPVMQRPFLKEFMEAAELVKFAKFPPDENILNNALNKAETLVNETRPKDDENKNSGGGDNS
ncbi:MAG: hypothetical protein PHV82_19125 [Victivallaceae bacterium]|nr:hypothetical protein [Victivallaceae bacterium]